MDGKQFDMIAKTLVKSSSRRGVVRTLLGGALAVGLARLGADAAVAAPNPPQTRCTGAGKSCNRLRPCCPGASCQQGTCTCKRGLTNCGGRCKNLQTDEANCGACGKKCLASQSCLFGTCCRNLGATCSGDVQCCSGLCLGGECTELPA